MVDVYVLFPSARTLSKNDKTLATAAATVSALTVHLLYFHLRKQPREGHGVSRSVEAVFQAGIITQIPSDSNRNDSFMFPHHHLFSLL